jgi:DNA-binding NtrC family response regulator
MQIQERETAVATLAEKPARKIRAFVFDDEAGVRHVLERILKLRGYEVFTFEDPRPFCTSCVAPGCTCGPAHTCAQILLSDVRMPGITGLDLVQKLEERGCHIRHKALISGFWTNQTMEEAHQMGCKVFQKPVSFGEINAWLEACERAISGEELAVGGFPPE